MCIRDRDYTPLSVQNFKINSQRSMVHAGNYLHMTKKFLNLFTLTFTTIILLFEKKLNKTNIETDPTILITYDGVFSNGIPYIIR